MTKYLIIIPLIFLFSCGDKNKKISKYPNGNIKTETTFNDNKLREGESIGYYEDGNIKWKSEYRNDTLNGSVLNYYSNGQISHKTYFKGGKKDGDFFEYYEDGKVKQRKYYKDGLANGFDLFYFHNGNKELEAFFKNDTSYYFTEYDSLGNMIDKVHLMKLQILSPLTTKDSIKIREIIHGYISTPDSPVSLLIEKYGTVKTGAMPQFKFNAKDSSYYYTFPPQKEAGQYIIKTTFLANKKFPNHLDTLITIGN